MIELDDLTIDERQALAYAAMRQVWNEEDSRYWTKDPAERKHRRGRWRQIAEAFGWTDEP